MSSNTQNLYPYQQMVSSSVGALLVSLFTTPFDVVKVRLQAQLKPERISYSIVNKVVETLCSCHYTLTYNSPVMCTTCGGNIRTVPRYLSTKDAFLKIAKFEGVGNLWRGLSPTLLQMVPQTVIYFTAYDQLKFKFGYVVGEKNVLPSLAAGVSGRVFAVMAVSPMEMMRTKLQSKKNLKYGELSLLVVNSIKHEGVFSMWRGIGPTLLRDVPFSAFYWVIYEALKSTNPNATIVINFSCGALAGMVAAFLVTPFDVVKTHRQIELGEAKQRTVQANRRLPLTFQIIANLFRTQGVASLYAGLIPRVAKIAPSCAIMISSYEYGKKYFADQNKMKR